MTKLTESAIGDFTIKLFERLGYSTIYAPDIAPDGEYPKNHRDTLLPKLISGEVRVNYV
jgi:type I restriction enzyme R subunit